MGVFPVGNAHTTQFDQIFLKEIHRKPTQKNFWCDSDLQKHQLEQACMSDASSEMATLDFFNKKWAVSPVGNAPARTSK